MPQRPPHDKANPVCNSRDCRHDKRAKCDGQVAYNGGGLMMLAGWRGEHIHHHRAHRSVATSKARRLEPGLPALPTGDLGAWVGDELQGNCADTETEIKHDQSGQ